MKKQIEHLLLSILIGLTILLALTFWLNTNFGFNLLSSDHWHELALFQASGENIDKSFYISIGVAIFIFFICLNIIYWPRNQHVSNVDTQPIENKKTLDANITQPATEDKKSDDIKIETKIESVQDTSPEPDPVSKQDEKNQEPEPISENEESSIRPPKLKLPKNIEQIAAIQYAQHVQNAATQTDKYDAELKKIFAENSFIPKDNATISGFTTNLFAIGANEIVWMGGVDCDIDKFKDAIQKLESTFQETLEDIVINVNTFIIDTMQKYESDDNIKIFHSVDELQEYISEHPGNKIADDDREDFEAYSDYIDTVLTLLYKT